jgi:hypothetical protein
MAEVGMEVVDRGVDFGRWLSRKVAHSLNVLAEGYDVDSAAVCCLEPQE